MDAGEVWINKHADLAPNIRSGGVRLSGVGVGVGVELGEKAWRKSPRRVVKVAKASQRQDYQSRRRANAWPDPDLR